MMIKNILIPTDGSDNSKTTLEYGISVAKRVDAKITGLHVIDIRIIQGPVLTDLSGSLGIPPSEVFMPDVQGGLDERAGYILKAFRERCAEAGFQAETVTSMGIIDEAIIDEGQRADLIILARRGEHLHLGGGRLGSTVESVVRKSGKPLMVTPETFREIESIGLAYDGSPPAENALKVAVELSEAASWPLTVIVISSDHDWASKMISRIEDYLEPFNIDAGIVILTGKEDREIVRFIHEGSVELMVMGAYGHNRLREFIIGSTTSYAIRNSAIPVLLVH
jgi:nucleotide-binding universal stress UspA family protein